MPNAKISRNPTQNGGIPRPISGTARTAWSRIAFWRVAAIIASGTLIMMASTVA
jgi:anti-sigma-K factor RskA